MHIRRSHARCYTVHPYVTHIPYDIHYKGWSYGDETEDIALLFTDVFFADERAKDWKIWVVSGTADAAVPFIGTERWMNCLNRTIETDWSYWYLNQDVAGAQLDYDGISLVTVKAVSKKTNKKKTFFLFSIKKCPFV